MHIKPNTQSNKVLPYSINKLFPLYSAQLCPVEVCSSNYPPGPLCSLPLHHIFCESLYLEHITDYPAVLNIITTILTLSVSFLQVPQIYACVPAK